MSKEEAEQVEAETLKDEELEEEITEVSPESEAKAEEKTEPITKAPIKGEEAGEEKAEKKAKPKKDEEEEEEKVLEEKIVTLNLRHAYLAYSRKPTPRSVRLVKKAAGRIFKSEDVKIDERLNAILWSRGKTKARRRVAVKVQKLEGGTVRVLPATE